MRGLGAEGLVQAPGLVGPGYFLHWGPEWPEACGQTGHLGSKSKGVKSKIRLGIQDWEGMTSTPGDSNPFHHTTPKPRHRHPHWAATPHAD